MDCPMPLTRIFNIPECPYLRKFHVIRVLLGFYFLYNLFMVLPYAGEMYGRNGLMSDPALNWNYGYFPNLLNHYDSTYQVQLFISAMIASSIFLLLGLQWRFFSLLLWYGWTGLFNRNFITENPHISYLGWLLVILIFIPSTIDGPEESPTRERGLKTLSLLRESSWLVAGMSYSFSGWSKLLSPSWLEGNALKLFMKIPFFLDLPFYRQFKEMPDLVLKLVTWSVLILEMVSILPFFFKKWRPLWWMGMLFMHLSLLVLWNLSAITVGMLIFHCLLFESRWFKKKLLRHAGDERSQLGASP